MRRHATLISVALMLFVGAVGYYFFFNNEKESFNKTLCLDFVRLTALIHHLKHMDAQRDDLSLAEEEKRYLQRIGMIVARWESEKDPNRKKVVDLMYSAILQLIKSKENYRATLAMYAEYIPRHISPSEAPLVQAAESIMKHDLLHLSAKNRRDIVQFVKNVMTQEAMEAGSTQNTSVERIAIADELKAVYLMRGD